MWHRGFIAFAYVYIQHRLFNITKEWHSIIEHHHAITVAKCRVFSNVLGFLLCVVRSIYFKNIALIMCKPHQCQFEACE